MPAKVSGKARMDRIIPLCDGVKTSREIADILGERVKYVQKVMKKFDLPRLPQAPRTGCHNPSYKTGRKIDRDGYVLVSAPPEHPHARKRKNRSYGVIYEHRLVMEKRLGRYLDPSETVDHIDGLRLHNDPSNLRLFDSNAEHLKATIKDRAPEWSEEGLRRLASRRHRELNPLYTHNYLKMKRNGDARLKEILLALLQLGEDSPYLLGTRHHLEKAGISDFSRPNLILELERLSRKYA